MSKVKKHIVEAPDMEAHVDFLSLGFQVKIVFDDARNEISVEVIQPTSTCTWDTNTLVVQHTPPASA